MAHEEMGPLFSDKKRTQDAEYLWQSLVKSGEAEPIKGGMYVMKEETNPPQYNVADELGTSMYTSDIRETTSTTNNRLSRNKKSNTIK